MARHATLTIRGARAALTNKDMELYKPLSAEEFAALSDYDQGFLTYMCGQRDDQPHIPDSKNPHAEGSERHQYWRAGNQDAYYHTQEIDS